MRSLSVPLRFPKKSHRAPVSLPRESVELAEFFGIMMGDGGINNEWQANVSLNTIADAQYILFVANSMERLFHKRPAVRARKNSNATIVSLASTTVVEFLVENGLVRGNKLAQGLEIPQWILGKKAYKMAAVRGLVDTDGCLVLHAHAVRGRVYKNLYLSFSSRSRILLGQVAEIFLELGYKPQFATNGREVYLYSARDVASYMRSVGTSNERIERVYRKWRDG